MIPPWNALLPIDISSQCGYHIRKRVFNFFFHRIFYFCLSSLNSRMCPIPLWKTHIVLNLKHLTALKPISTTKFDVCQRIWNFISIFSVVSVFSPTFVWELESVPQKTYFSSILNKKYITQSFWVTKSVFQFSLTTYTLFHLNFCCSEYTYTKICQKFCKVDWKRSYLNVLVKYFWDVMRKFCG